MPDEAHALFGSPWWDKWDRKEKNLAIREFEAWRLSQFMHGEQGALISVAKIVQTVPNIDSKFYAATQTIDEARHVEVYSRYLHDKIGLVYPLNGNLASLLNDTVTDTRWDMTYLGMQVLIEGLALASFGLIRNMASEPLAQAINAYVMQDEARHVMFGRLALRDYYPHLTQAERDEREEFCVDACYRMRDRFMAEEVWERLDLPPETTTWVEESELFAQFRVYLFTRIVPVIKDIGLWGPKIRDAFADMGVIAFADSDIDAEMAGDEGGAVVVVGEDPHAVAATLGRDVAQPGDERPSEAGVAIGPVDGQLVEEHLGALVGMRHLDAAHEPGGTAVDVGDEQVVPLVRQEPAGRFGVGGPVEQVGGLGDELLVARPQPPDVHLPRPVGTTHHVGRHLGRRRGARGSRRSATRSSVPRRVGRGRGRANPSAWRPSRPPRAPRDAPKERRCRSGDRRARRM